MDLRIGKRWRRASFALSSRPTSPSYDKRSKTSYPKPSCVRPLSLAPHSNQADERRRADLLVNFSRESVQNRLVASLYKESLFEDLLYEDEGLTAERTRVKSLLQAYKEAFSVRPLFLSLSVRG